MGRPRIYGEELRKRLILATAESLLADGPDGLSLRAIASSCETSTTAIYSLFGGKDQLIAQVLEHGHDDLREALSLVPETDDPLTDLTALGQAYRKWAIAHPALYQVMWADRSDVHQFRDDDPDPCEAIAPLRDGVGRAIADGVFRDEDVEEVSVSIWASTHGMITLELSGFLDNSTAEQRYDSQLLAAAWFWLKHD